MTDCRPPSRQIEPEAHLLKTYRGNYWRRNTCCSIIIIITGPSRNLLHRVCRALLAKLCRCNITLPFANKYVLAHIREACYAFLAHFPQQIKSFLRCSWKFSIQDVNPQAVVVISRATFILTYVYYRNIINRLWEKFQGTNESISRAMMCLPRLVV